MIERRTVPATRSRSLYSGARWKMGPWPHQGQLRKWSGNHDSRIATLFRAQLVFEFGRMVCSFPSSIHCISIHWYVGIFLWRCVFRSNCKSPACVFALRTILIHRETQFSKNPFVRPIFSSSLIAGGALANSFNNWRAWLYTAVVLTLLSSRSLLAKCMECSQSIQSA